MIRLIDVAQLAGIHPQELAPALAGSMQVEHLPGYPTLLVRQRSAIWVPLDAAAAALAAFGPFDDNDAAQRAIQSHRPTYSHPLRPLTDCNRLAMVEEVLACF